jgi:hypothetical protein
MIVGKQKVLSAAFKPWDLLKMKSKSLILIRCQVFKFFRLLVEALKWDQS